MKINYFRLVYQEFHEDPVLSSSTPKYAYVLEAYLELSPTSTMEIFCENS